MDVISIWAMLFIFVKSLESKSQRVYLHHFKSIVVVHRAKIQKIVP